MKDILAGIQTDLIKVFTAIAMAFAGFAIYLICFKSFQLYFGIEVGTRYGPLLIHGSKVKKIKWTGLFGRNCIKYGICAIPTTAYI
jgi:hypothetical protein